MNPSTYTNIEALKEFILYQSELSLAEMMLGYSLVDRNAIFYKIRDRFKLACKCWK
jgi:hypothetical protein